MTEIDSPYQESVANDSGYASFTFDAWQDNTPVSPEKITFEHLKYSDVDFRRTPNEIEIIQPMTVTNDEFTIGNTNWINSYNFAVMNDVHIGDGLTDFGSNGWDDDTITGQTNEYIHNKDRCNRDRGGTKILTLKLNPL